MRPRVGDTIGPHRHRAWWIRFPDLTIERLRQRYVRSGDTLYRYSSNGGAFTADIEVDDEGLVVRYPPLWDRVI